MSIDSSIFDFDNMVAALGANPFNEVKKWATDDRFYVLPKDEKGEGAAVIAFLPDPDLVFLQQIYRINTTITKDGQRRFCNELSPTTIKQRCPFQDKWQELFNSGKREEARTFARATRYFANIYVVKDPRKPENEGKVFLYDMSSVLKNKLDQAVNPSSQDIATGAQRKEVFNPTKGWVMRLIAHKQQGTGMIEYNASEIIQMQPIFPDDDTAKKFIEQNCYRLSDFLKPEAYKSYDELKVIFDRVTFADATESAQKVNKNPTHSDLVDATSVSNPVASTGARPDDNKDELNELLSGLV